MTDAVNSSESDWHSATPTRIIAGLIITLTVLLACWGISGAYSLLYRPCWMDEVHTWLLATDPNTNHALQALADGVDYNPPGYFLLARVCLLFSSEDRESALRLLSFTMILLAMVAIYLLVVTRSGVPAAILATIFTGGHPLVVQQLTEMRFYAAWLMAAAWLGVLLQWVLKTRIRRGLGYAAMLGTITLSAFICTCHYFGIISLTLVIASYWQSDHGRSTRVRLLVILAAGFTALILCTPFLIGQRLALSRPTWVSAPTAQSSMAFLDETIPWAAILVLLLTIGICNLYSGRPLLFRYLVKDVAFEKCSALLLMAPILLLFSWTIQPSLVPRYATVGILGSASVIGVLAGRIPLPLQTLGILMSAILAAKSGHTVVQAWTQFDKAQTQLIAELDSLPAHACMLFEDRTMWLPVVHRRPDLRNRCLLVDFEDSQMEADSALRAVQRDAGRRICKWYPSFQMRGIDETANAEELWIVTYHMGSDHDLRYPPGFRRDRLGPSLFHFTRLSVHAAAR